MAFLFRGLIMILGVAMTGRERNSGDIKFLGFDVYLCINFSLDILSRMATLILERGGRSHVQLIQVHAQGMFKGSGVDVSTFNPARAREGAQNAAL